MSNVPERSAKTGYGWVGHIAPHTHEFISAVIIDILKNLEVKRICDLGSGNGALCGTLNNIGYEVVGVEPDRDGFEISKKKYPFIRFYNLGVEGNPEKIRDIESSFDVVISTEVIEHLYSPELLPVFARSLLKDNGYLIISTPYHGYIKNLAISLLGKWDSHHAPLWNHGHIKFWSRKTLSTLLKKCGFKLIGFYGAGRFRWLWKSMISVAVKV